MLFDITVAADFLRALLRLLEEWEYYCEKGAKGMVCVSIPSNEDSRGKCGTDLKQKSLFKSQKGKRDKGELLEAESYLVYINLVRLKQHCCRAVH